ncbi:MAG: hypothetical protein ACI4JJ_00930 [Huintestinicola sp.]
MAFKVKKEAFPKAFEKAREAIDKFMKSRYAMTAAVGTGLLGMLLILFSGGSDNDSAKESADTETGSCVSSSSDYCRETEESLENILSAIEGVGEVKVMVTVSSSEEYIYADTTEKDDDREKQEYVILKDGSKEQALVRKVKSPVITGVVVVCDGGGSARVCEKIYKAVTAAVNIPSSRIYVAEKE